MTLRFEWNKSKAKDNYAKHGVSFELATRVFQDPFAVEFVDDRHEYGEKRFVIIGMADGYALNVVFAERNDIIRIISARRAMKHEEEAYIEQNT